MVGTTWDVPFRSSVTGLMTSLIDQFQGEISQRSQHIFRPLNTRMKRFISTTLPKMSKRVSASSFQAPLDELTWVIDSISS